jgi:hypothetical protein
MEIHDAVRLRFLPADLKDRAREWDGIENGKFEKSRRDFWVFGKRGLARWTFRRDGFACKKGECTSSLIDEAKDRIRKSSGKPQFREEPGETIRAGCAGAGP